ncbi:hypothetical protein DSO57_1009572 [Entomophthora muscae]|uniref:Uncharacterized protein n=1 Tax=Entomophthora muscae TaxID=34485 RepID=A0ACC2RXW9_9FUNG|nr:hypothetical protein DSO57_1009572 [Entomophthora muscae]
MIVWFLTLRNSLAPLMLVASDPTVLPRLVEIIHPGPHGFPVVCLCHASEHDNIQYKKGAELVTADALSRLCHPREDHPDHLDPGWPNLYSTEYKTKGKDPSTHQLTHNTLVRKRITSMYQMALYTKSLTTNMSRTSHLHKELTPY